MLSSGGESWLRDASRQAARRAGHYQTAVTDPAGAWPLEQWRGSFRSGVRPLGRVTAMKIAVCVKQVPDATVHKRLDPSTHRLDRSGEGTLNATDVNAVEEALRLKEAQGGEVLVVSLGPEKAMDSLRKALAMGADRAVLVSDEGAAGSDLLATGRALAKDLMQELRRRVRALVDQLGVRQPEELTEQIVLLIDGAFSSAQVLGKEGPHKFLVQAADAASAGRRRTHLAPRSSALARRAKMGSPRK